MSPAQALGALRDRCRETFPDGLPHTGNGKEIDGLLDGAPVFFGQEDGVHALGRNHNGLMRSSRLPHELTQIGFGFRSWNGRHARTVSEHKELVKAS